MKEKANVKVKIALIVIIAMVLLIIGIIRVPNVIEKVGVKVAEKEEQDAGVAQVLSGKTFTSSSAGVAVSGTMADYSNNMQTITLSASETGSSITKSVPAGYHTQLTVDASAVYNKGYTDGNILGKEVTAGGEPFFVISENSIDSTVTLLAKYCLNTSGSAQSINGGHSTYKCAFSSSNYWSSVWTSGNRLNLNGVNGNFAGDAMTKAQNYARTIGGKSASGRLLTYEEANALKTNYSSMIFGTYNTASGEAYLNYWVGSTIGGNDYGMWYVNGNSSDLYTFYYYTGDSLGVRPVITVPKSVVSGL